MTLLAAFEILLYYYTGQTDLVVGTPIANRTRQEIEGLIGFFVNTLVLRTRLSGNPTFRELLERVRETALGAMLIKIYRLRSLSKGFTPARPWSHTTFPDNVCHAKRFNGKFLTLPGLSVTPLEDRRRSSQT